MPLIDISVEGTNKKSIEVVFSIDLAGVIKNYLKETSLLA